MNALCKNNSTAVLLQVVARKKEARNIVCFFFIAKKTAVEYPSLSRVHMPINHPAQFVSGLVGAYRRAGCAYPVFANLRNGLWYGSDWDGTCYFKSTDGHSGRCGKPLTYIHYSTKAV